MNKLYTAKIKYHKDNQSWNSTLHARAERDTGEFGIEDCTLFKQKAFEWARQFDTVCYFDNNQYEGYTQSDLEGLIAVGVSTELVKFPQDAGNAFDHWKAFFKEEQDWLFGFLSYDLKNEVEQLQSDNFDALGFPDLHFFNPRCVIEIFKNSISIHIKNATAQECYDEIINQDLSTPIEVNSLEGLQPRISKKDYLKTINAIHQHILKGDIYEMNFCQEFFSEHAAINPYEVFLSLNKLSKAPFSAFYKHNDRYLLCASPERFIKKQGNFLLSQPIKGTIKRGKDEQEDLQLAERLFNSKKDRSENVMIVDLVRNDLSKSCKPGTVKVDELFGIYTFEQVIQMISTVKGELRDDIHFIDAIRNAFPMGSMTGAPKVRAMQLIEHYEKTKRGLYSGAIGYIRPDGDFDFNVVIRSLLYNAADKYLSLQVGGAIVFDSKPEQEYEECLLKARAMFQVLGLDSKDPFST